MAELKQSDRIANASAGQQALPSLIELALSTDDSMEFRQAAIKIMNAVADGIEMSAIVRGVKGTWRTLASSANNGSSGDGEAGPLPYEFLSEVLDNDRCAVRDGWIAVPLEVPNVRGRLLTQKLQGDSDASTDGADGRVADRDC